MFCGALDKTSETWNEADVPGMDQYLSWFDIGGYRGPHTIVIWRILGPAPEWYSREFCELHQFTESTDAG